MSEKLNFSIGVDLSELNNGLNEAGKEIKNFTDANKRQFERAGLAIAGLGASIVAIAQNVGGAGSAISQTFEGIARAISEGDIPTLIGLVTSALGVLIGLIPTIVSGIALVRTAFAALSLTMAANPIGAIIAAIGLAIVGIIAAVQLFTNSVDKLAVKKNLLNEVNLMAVKSLAKEKSELVSLLSVAKDVTIPYNQRLKAVKKLNEISPEYLGNITLENLETRKTVDAIDAYNEAIIKKARAQAANKLLTENIEKQLALELTGLKLNSKALTAETDARLKATMSEESYLKVKQNILGNAQRINDVTDKSLAKLEAERKKILDLIKANEGYDISLKKVAETKELVNTPQVSGVDAGMQPLGIAEQPNTSMITATLGEIIPEVDMALQRILEVLGQFNEQANVLIQDAISGTFESLGQAIGNAFANGGNIIQNLGRTILSQMGKFLSSFGALAIKYGTAALFINKASASLFTPAGIGAAVGLIAAGIALSAAGSAISSTAQGGFGGGSINSGGASTSYSQGAGGISNTVLSQGSNEVVFRISGSDLLGVLRRAEGNEQRLG